MVTKDFHNVRMLQGHHQVGFFAKCFFAELLILRYFQSNICTISETLRPPDFAERSSPDFFQQPKAIAKNLVLRASKEDHRVLPVSGRSYSRSRRNSLKMRRSPLGFSTHLTTMRAHDDAGT